MSDRYNFLTVALEHDIRSDDAEPIIEAIKLIRGVANVEGAVAHSGDWANREQVKYELRSKLWGVLND